MKTYQIIVLPDCDTWSEVNADDPAYLLRLTADEFERLQAGESPSSVVDFRRYTAATALIKDDHPTILPEET